MSADPRAGGVLVIGEALVDVVDGTPHPGGSPLNVAVGLARLGHAASFVGRFGRDEFGDLIARHLRDNGVRSLLPADAQPTSVALATLAPDGSATYQFELVWELPGLPQVLPAALRDARLLHTGSIATVLHPGAASVLAAIERARAEGVRVSFDPNCRPSITPDAERARAAVEAFVALSDLVKASDEDLRWLYPDRSVQESAQEWRRLGPGLVVVTRGSQGAFAASAAGLIAVPARPVAVADTVGAGDSFMAALIDGVLELGERGLGELTASEVEGLLARAGAAASLTVGRPGADPPTRPELDAALSR